MWENRKTRGLDKLVRLEMEEQLDPLTTAMLVLDSHCQLNPNQILPPLHPEALQKIELPLPCGYCPLLLIMAPEDAVTRMKPSPEDILSYILGSLLPGSTGANVARVRSLLRQFPAGGSSL